MTAAAVSIRASAFLQIEDIILKATAVLDYSLSVLRITIVVDTVATFLVKHLFFNRLLILL